MPATSNNAPLLVLVNGASGEHDLQATRATLSGIFQTAERSFSFVEADAGGNFAEVCDETAAKAARCGGIVVAVGGDGTINAVATAAWRHGCALGVIPQGTFNYFGRDHGIAQELEAAARALVDAQATPVQVGEVNGLVFLVNASLGLYPQLLQDRETFKNRLGRKRWVAMLAGLVTLFQWRRQLHLEIELDGRRTVLKTPTLFVGNNHLQLERVGIDDATAGQVGVGRLAAIVPNPIGTWALLGLTLRGSIGRLGEADQVRSFSFDTLNVRVLRMRRLKLATDGEVTVATPPLVFRVSPKPLTLMLPLPRDRVAVE